MQNRELHFKNGKFRIVQLADIQERYNVSSDTLKLLNAALDRAQPDLVILTGDQIKGYSPSFKMGNTATLVEETFNRIFSPITKRNIPFTATFGNHDDQCGISNSEQFEMYKKFPGFVYADPAGTGDDGTFCLNVDGRFLIYLFDTHSKDGKGGYGALHKNQVEWYRETRDSYGKKCGRLLPSMAFQHIPTPEYFEVIKKTRPFSSGSIRAYGEHSYEWYTLDPYNSELRDFLGEPPATSVTDSGEVRAFLEQGEMRALFVGHDHNDSFTAGYRGLTLGITQSCGFNAYGPGRRRGVRVIDINEDGTFSTFTLTYIELCGDELDNKLRYGLYEIAPVSVAGFKTKAKEISLALGVAGAAFGSAFFLKKKK